MEYQEWLKHNFKLNTLYIHQKDKDCKDNDLKIFAYEFWNAPDGDEDRYMIDYYDGEFLDSKTESTVFMLSHTEGVNANTNEFYSQLIPYPHPMKYINGQDGGYYPDKLTYRELEKALTQLQKAYKHLLQKNVERK